MYENKTFENIMANMLSTVNVASPDIDTREGSLIYNALAPAAFELAIAYNELDNVLRESFVDTASRQYLYVLCNEMGMDTTQFEANQGLFKAEFDIEVPIGSTWNHDIYNYTITDYDEYDSSTQHYMYEATCNTATADANTVFGTLTAISNPELNPTFAQITECLILGENQKSDQYIRDYYYKYIGSTATDGNLGQYARWMDEYEGIGTYKLFPLWNGANTLKLSILDAENDIASSTLVNAFQAKVNPLGENNSTSGLGLGLAPLGAYVTVSTASAKTITVSGTITLKSGFTTTDSIDELLRQYFASLAYRADKVAYLNVGAIILQSEAVESVSNLKINNGTADVSLSSEQIPKLGTTTWTIS